MKGTSYTYFTTDNAKQARELIGILREANAQVPPQLEEMSMFGGGGGGFLPASSDDPFGGAGQDMGSGFQDASYDAGGGDPFGGGGFDSGGGGFDQT